MTAKQLTDSILQLAIQGKLVPQNPNDEPASVLLDRIREEKKRLVKEGKLKKKDLEETPISEDEIPFEIPESWEWRKLNDLADIVRGGSPRPAGSPVFYGGNIPFLKVADLTREKSMYVTKHTSTIKEAGLNKTREVEANTLLLTNSGATLGVPKICTFQTTFNDGIAAFLYLSEDIKRYVYWFLCSKTEQFRSINQGTAQPNLNTDIIKDTLIPIPPLAEQHRIIKGIENILPLVDEYGLANEKLEQINAELPEKLKKSILQEAIMGKLGTQNPNDEPASVLLDRIREEKKQLVKAGVLKKKDLVETPVEEDEMPFTLPNGWSWCRIDDYTNKVTDFVASGSFASLRENVKYYKEENYALLVKTKDFQSDFKRDLTYTDEHGYKFLENSNLFGGELILSNVGSIGRIFIVPKLNRKMSLAPNAIMVRLWNDSHRDWLYYLFQSDFGINLLYGISSATAIRKFNKTDFKKLVIPLPPLAEQHRIVEKIEALFAEVDHMEI